MTTAYEEALAKIQSGADLTGASVPSYINSADTLNTANGNTGFVESALSVLEDVPKFIGVSVISGANQLYNIPADIGNLVFDLDIERSNTDEVITSLDSDLGSFYREHQEGADLVGFMISSIVPGLGGIKMLNAGQKSLRTAISAGKFGENTGKALGLLAPLKKVHLDKALLEVTTNSSAASLLNRNALKAIGAGFGQNALEATAFEIAVATTLFKSPILENQDFGDFVSNVAWGAGVFGFIGGIIDTTKIKFSLKALADKSAIEARPWQFIDEAASASQGYEKIALDFAQLNAIPKVPAGLEPSRAAFLEQAAVTKVTTLNNRIRKEIGELSGGDQEVAETLFQTFTRASLNDQHSAFIGLQTVTKHGTTSAVAKRAEVLAKKVATGKATVKELDEFADSSIEIAYAKSWGEGVGVVTTDRPIITSLVDILKKGEKIKVTPTKVTAGAKKFTFTTHFNTGKRTLIPGASKPWNILQADALEANARYIWASKLPKFEPTAAKPLTVHVNDIPLMEKVMLELADTPAMEHVKFAGLAKNEFVGRSLQDFLGKRKVALANKMLENKVLKQDEIAAIVNVKSSFLSGEVVRDSVSEYSLKDLLAMQDHAETYTKDLIAKGARREAEGVVDIWNIPQHVNLTYDTTPFKTLNNFTTENMVIIKEQQKLYQEGTARAAAKILGDDYNKLEDITSGRVFSGAAPSGAGAGFATAASSNYGTLAASVEGIGANVSRMIDKGKARAREALEPLLYKLGNSKQASIEWSTLNARVRGIEGEYGLNAAGDALEPLALLRWKKASEEAVEAGLKPPKRPILSNPAMEARIELVSQEVRDLAKAHIEINGTRTNGLAGIRTAQGTQFNRAPDAFYPIPIDTKDFPHFAIVTDESITSGNHSKTLFAASAEELDGMIKKLKENPQLRIRTKNEAEDYFRSQGTWDYEKTLNNNYLDTEAHRKGVSSPFFVATDPNKITSDMLNWHLQRETGLVREAVTAKYEVQFNELRRLGDEATNIATSKFSNANLVEFAEDAVKNPFADYIKTALNLRKTTDYPWWVKTNQMADKAVSTLLKKITAIVDTSTDPKALEQVNDMLTKAGYKGAAYDESMQIFANSEPAKGALTATIQKANSIMATVVLRWDALNAVNNAVSANVLLGAETKAVTRAILRGDKEAVGALSKLMDIKVPGVDELIRAPQKLVSNAIMKFNRNGSEMKWFKDNGYVTSISDQYRSALDSLTFTGKESVKNWDARVNKLHTKLRDLADSGEKWTGNRLAEEFNRFVAADVMKQMTDIAVTRGLMTGKEQLAYINTFVNRTQGNYLAAQRPMMFQGPIGQAIGLFQTYQFNLMQQLLRHVGEGHAKDSMVLLALQGTIHGMNGLPAFNAINTYIVGNASGNTEHKDAFSAVYGAAGKEAGDWLMYGMASNATGLLHPDLKVNLYTRGDINPRQVTLVPTNPADVPFIAATGKVLSNLFKTAETLVNGGDVVNTILQGIEHNGLSRPLAGLAQTLQGFDNPQQASYSTSNQGNVIAANDLLSLTNLARVVGGKPLDEAIALDATYRFKAYGLVDSKRRQVLGNAIKTTMIAGGDPSQEQVEDFAESYAKMGGRQDEFNKWFGQLYKTANLSQANKIQQSLRSPFTQSMQRIMGGKELRDFSSIVPEKE
jgi:predicted XRE-type DNA-binding protein